MTFRILLIALTTLAITCGNAFANPSTRTLCSDGWVSPSTGSGTCSWHGGISGGSSGGDYYYSPPSGGGSQNGDPVYGWRVRSPSGNLQCVYANSTIACTSKALDKTAYVTVDGRAWVRQGVLRVNGGPVLPYGAFWNPDPNPDLGCLSDTDGIYCSSNGRYIWLSKTFIRRGYE